MKSFVGLLAAVVLAASCSACGNADGATNTSAGQAGSLTAKTVAAAPDVPETLSAATAAAQANVDLFSSGDSPVSGSACHGRFATASRKRIS